MWLVGLNMLVGILLIIMGIWEHNSQDIIMGIWATVAILSAYAVGTDQ